MSGHKAERKVFSFYSMEPNKINFLRLFGDESNGCLFVGFESMFQIVQANRTLTFKMMFGNILPFWRNPFLNTIMGVSARTSTSSLKIV